MSDSIPKPLKCMIKNLDTGEEVEAHFNPKELAVEKSVPWNKHKDSKGDTPLLEFTDAEPKTMSVELLFDTYESRKSVYKKYVKTLESFTLIVDAKKKRPPMCIFLWGKNFPSFMGVIETLSTKYTMFLADGTPVRARLTVSFSEYRNIELEAKEVKRETADYSKRHVVLQGETLSSIAGQAYGDPRLWRVIAAANRLQRARRLTPGTRLLLPHLPWRDPETGKVST